MADPLLALGGVLGRDISRLGLHAGNLANANTIGFRAQIAGAAATAGTATSLRPGQLQATGRALDVAIIGEAFFVSRGSGESWFLERNGHLRLDTDGYLATESGARLQGEGGEILVGNGSEVRIGLDGSVTAGGETVGRLLLARAPADAERLPDGRLRGTTPPEAASGIRLASGVLERANVDVAAEMTQMMMTSRHLESTQRALQWYDGVLSTGINQIGKE